MFENRKDAGIALSQKLKQYKNKKNVLILGIARGGVVVAAQIAQFLRVSLSVLVIKKIGAPYNNELAIGAVAPGGLVFWDFDLCQRLRLSQTDMNELSKKAVKAQKEREKLFGLGSKTVMKSKTIVVVDDGVATGTTVLAAAQYVRSKTPKELILATPVIAKDVLTTLADQFDKIVAVEIVGEFQAVGQFYKEFGQITDEEVIKIV